MRKRILITFSQKNDDTVDYINKNRKSERKNMISQSGFDYLEISRDITTGILSFAVNGKR